MLDIPMTKEEWMRATTRIIADDDGTILSLQQGELAEPMTKEQASALVLEHIARRK